MNTYEYNDEGDYDRLIIGLNFRVPEDVTEFYAEYELSGYGTITFDLTGW